MDIANATETGIGSPMRAPMSLNDNKNKRCGASMQHTKSDLACKLSRSIKTFECTLPNRCSIEALDQALAVAELLRGSGDPKLVQFATRTIERCARFVLSCADEELTGVTERAVAKRWWDLGQRFVGAGYTLPAGFTDVLLVRAQKIFLRRTIEMLKAADPAAGPTPLSQHSSIIRELAAAIVGVNRPEATLRASA